MFNETETSMNPAIGQAAKKWHDLEKQFPSIPVQLCHGVQELESAMSSYHANGKHEAMVDLFKLLRQENLITDAEACASYIEEGCVEFDHVDVAVCGDSSGMSHYLRVHFDGKTEVL